MKEIEKYIKDNDIGKILKNVSLKNYTTYKAGGTASYLVFPKETSKLISLLKFLKQKEIKYMVIGNGSNLLFSDKNYDGVLIKLTDMNKVTIIDNKVIAGAGASLIKVAAQSIKKGLTGLEFATGIPGTIGGAVYMNAGAYKSDMGYVVQEIKVLTKDFQVITMVNRELDFHYRSSFLQKNKDYICLEATFKLNKGDKEVMDEIVNERRKRRIESQPLEYPSAGSVFRNPEGDFAGRLIEELGYKGYSKGGAQVSEKHANFVINKKDASAEDIKYLIDFLKKEVKEKYNIELKVEQEFVNWDE